MNNNLTVRVLRKINNDLFKTYQRNVAERGETLTASDAAAHEIIHAWIARFAPNDDALIEALENVRDDIDEYLPPEGDSAATERTSELVKTYVARFAHDEPAVVDALKTIRDHIDDFLLWMVDRIDGID